MDKNGARNKKSGFVPVLMVSVINGLRRGDPRRKRKKEEKKGKEGGESEVRGAAPGKFEKDHASRPRGGLWLVFLVSA